MRRVLCEYITTHGEHTVRKDPKQLKSLRCRCGNPLPEAAARDGDPWCSTVCCKEFHGVEIQAKKPGVPVGASA